MPTQAARELKLKLALEKKLKRKLEGYNFSVVDSFKSHYMQNGGGLNINAFNDELTGILANHWREVGLIFGDLIGPRLPKDIAKTDGERKVIAEALSLWQLHKVPLHARQINATTQDDIGKALEKAEEDELAQGLIGVERQRVVGAVAANHLRQSLNGRLLSTAITETQIPAETAKATEAQVLTGIPPRISGNTRRASKLKKRWDSVGDSLVRPWHLDADGQTVPENEPFVVGGEQLMQPGDDSLGASAKNIINCRCGAEYDVKQIVDIRRAA